MRVIVDRDDMELLRRVVGRDPATATIGGLYWSLRGGVGVALVVFGVVVPLLWLFAAAEGVALALEWHLHRRARPARHRFDGTFSVRPNGLHRRSPSAEILLPWESIDRVVQVSGALVVRFDGTGGWVIPGRCFATPEDRDEFFSTVAERVASPPPR